MKLDRIRKQCATAILRHERESCGSCSICIVLRTHLPDLLRVVEAADKLEFELSKDKMYWDSVQDTPGIPGTVKAVADYRRVRGSGE